MPRCPYLTGRMLRISWTSSPSLWYGFRRHIHPVAPVPVDMDNIHELLFSPAFSIHYCPAGPFAYQLVSCADRCCS